ncbi:MAG: N-acetyltransferase [Caulobacterales bacterium]|nr:N-acetyltransferase [Caulobacterales bacterium]
MTEPVITLEMSDKRHGRYVARIDGVEGEGEITITRRGPHLISADHTGVPETMAGLGVGMKLIAFMLDDARANDFKIIPLCPYVRAQYARHPEWAELFTTKPGEDPVPPKD